MGRGRGLLFRGCLRSRLRSRLGRFRTDILGSRGTLGLMSRRRGTVVAAVVTTVIGFDGRRREGSVGRRHFGGGGGALSGTVVLEVLGSQERVAALVEECRVMLILAIDSQVPSMTFSKIFQKSFAVLTSNDRSHKAEKAAVSTSHHRENLCWTYFEVASSVSRWLSHCAC
jgi:hypothetical protein